MKEPKTCVAICGRCKQAWSYPNRVYGPYWSAPVNDYGELGRLCHGCYNVLNAARNALRNLLLEV